MAEVRRRVRPRRAPARPPPPTPRRRRRGSPSPRDDDSSAPRRRGRRRTRSPTRTRAAGVARALPPSRRRAACRATRESRIRRFRRPSSAARGSRRRDGRSPRPPPAPPTSIVPASGSQPTSPARGLPTDERHRVCPASRRAGSSAEPMRPGAPLTAIRTWPIRTGTQAGRACCSRIDEACTNVVERLWPGREARVRCSAAASRTTISRSRSARARRTSCASPGSDTELLGIDRRVEYEASLAAAAVGVGPEVVAFVEPEGYLVTRFIEGEIVRRSGCAIRRRSGASRGRCARSTRPAARRALRQLPDRRGVPLDGVRARRGGAARVRVGTTDRARDRAGARAGARAAVPQRPAQRELHRRRLADPHRRLGVRGHGRRLLRPRQLLDQPRARRGRARACCSRPTSGDVRPADERALELMRFMSDFREAMWGVVQAAISGLDFDFAGYAARALRPARADRRRAGVPGCALRL